VYKPTSSPTKMGIIPSCQYLDGCRREKRVKEHEVTLDIFGMDVALI